MTILPAQLSRLAPVETKDFSHAVKEFTWCRGRDLVAVLLETGELFAARVGAVGRAWTFPARGASTVESFVWRPDGRAIAIGMSDGTVSLHGGETGVMMHRLLPGPYGVKVTNVEWAESGASDDDVSPASPSS
ncbi:Anaphase-promoting complex subunit 4 [Irineochytrium annulatum]|nr:Anaphase-promoting complex subunit 4 [Irineochytrium annulatum]